MQVRITHGIVGHGFDYRAGDTAEQEVFAAHAGSGWRLFCVPIEPTKREAVAEPQVERAVKPKPATARRGRAA